MKAVIESLGEDAKPKAVGVISAEITEQKRAEVELHYAKEAAETANRAKSEFLANNNETGGMQNESERALCKKTLQGLKELGSDMGESFFSQLLETFEHDAVEHLAALRSAVTGGDTGRLCGEAHALKGASLTIGARGMADICQRLENFGTAQNLVGASKELARLDHEFERVKSEIEKENPIN